MRKIIDYKNIEKFETAMRNWYIDNTKNESFKDQLKNTLVKEVEYTGAGFYINYKNSLNPSDLNTVTRSHIDGPDFITGNADGMCGSLLFLRNDIIVCMEIFIYCNHIDDHIDDFELIAN